MAYSSAYLVTLRPQPNTHVEAYGLAIDPLLATLLVDMLTRCLPAPGLIRAVLVLKALNYQKHELRRRPIRWQWHAQINTRYLSLSVIQGCKASGSGSGR